MPHEDPPELIRRLEAAQALAQSGRFADARRRALSSLGRGRAPHGEDRARVAKALAEIAARASAGGQPEEAERSLRAALRLEPRFPDLRFRLAQMLESLGRLEEAVDELSAALEVNPAYLAARVERAMLRARLGQLGEAVEELRGLGQASQPEAAETFERGLESLQRAEWEAAAEQLRRAYGLGRQSLDAEIARFMRLLADGDLQHARLLLRDLVIANPAYPDLHFMLGRVELQQGYADDAVASLSRALELNPQFHSARVELAHALEGAGQVALAREQIQAVLQSDPEHPGARGWRERWSRKELPEEDDILLDPDDGSGQSNGRVPGL